MKSAASFFTSTCVWGNRPNLTSDAVSQTCFSIAKSGHCEINWTDYWPNDKHMLVTIKKRVGQTSFCSQNVPLIFYKTVQVILSQHHPWQKTSGPQRFLSLKLTCKLNLIHAFMMFVVKKNCKTNPSEN